MKRTMVSWADRIGYVVASHWDVRLNERFRLLQTEPNEQSR